MANDLEKIRINRKIDSVEKAVIKGLTEKILSLKYTIKGLREQVAVFTENARDRAIYKQGE